MQDPQVDPEKDPVLARALVGTLRDEWRPAADAMRSAHEWERRAYITLTLAAAARRRVEWLRNWLTARPDDADATAVHHAMESLGEN
ncbi:hypothetical protein SAMN04488074_10647 [Lentzea albidocapillata subsp. violacea]|uniref:Uncharacterized protein n=1 Tax=Lentzea albidocapillata subsp. violacea TaxID=128104 RepID=A0A1G9CTB4_9PSEU|nr:hypothetical protein [Lentzea albidocapillata]SDK54910.1 hypothetical protein SAMN04488074_10647 [Lentzea albidocapillata subsp. violacea]